jgi:glycerol-3-phosphate acyltransferase PlsY
LGKGVPFVALGYSLFEMREETVMAIGLAAILGSVFSPMLQFRGGKSLAVTGGVLLALPEHEMVISVAAFLLLGFFFIRNDAWVVVFGMAGPLLYLAAMGRSVWEPLFMLGVLVILAAKHREELKTVPEFEVRPASWLRAKQHRA